MNEQDLINAIYRWMFASLITSCILGIIAIYCFFANPINPIIIIPLAMIGMAVALLAALLTKTDET